MGLRPPPLLAITPGDGRILTPWFEALARANLPAVLLREPQLDAAAYAEVVDIARALFPIVMAHGRCPWPLDRPGLLRHEPHGGHGAVSASCHSAAEVDHHLAAGRTFVLWSPVFAPTSKPADHRDPIGIDAFLQVAAGRPVLALGGIDAARYQHLRASGACGAAVIGDIFGQKSPADAAARLADYGSLVVAEPSKTKSAS